MFRLGPGRSLVQMWRGALSSSKLSFSSKLFHRNFCSEIFVSRLSYYTTEDELQKIFSPFGKIKEVRLVRDDKTRRPKGYAFVRFESEVDAERAIKGMDKRSGCTKIESASLKYWRSNFYDLAGCDVAWP